MLALLLSGCAAASVPVESEVCLGVLPLANSHVAALLDPAVPDGAVVTGANLITALKDGCGWVVK